MLFRISTTIVLVLTLIGLWWASGMLDPDRYSECRAAAAKREEVSLARADLQRKGLMDVLLTDIPKLPEPDRKAISDWEAKTSEAREMGFLCQRELDGPRFFRTVFMVLSGIAAVAALLAIFLRR